MKKFLLKTFEKYYRELEQLGFKVSASANPNANIAYLFAQNQRVGTFKHRPDNTMLLNLNVEVFNYEHFMNTGSKSVIFWWAHIPEHETHKFVSEDDGMFQDIRLLSEQFARYSNEVKKTNNFLLLTKQDQNAYILPFFLAGYHPSTCTAVLPYNIDATEPLAMLVENNDITFTEMELFKDLPNEVLNAYSSFTVRRA